MKSQREIDQILLQKVQAGDKHAFDLLVAPYRGRLMRLIQRTVHDIHDAEDVLQDTLIRAYRGVHGFRGDAAFYTWVFRIGINTATAFAASKRRRLLDYSEPLDEANGSTEGPWDSVTPEDVLMGKQLAETVGAALASMAPEHSAAITLREVDGLSYQEIALEMVCPIGTVRSRIANARTVIAARLRAMRAPQ